MKTLKKSELVDGFKLIQLHMCFELAKGIIKTFDPVKVEVRDGVTHDPRCDLVVHGSSVCYKAIFELGMTYDNLGNNAEFSLQNWNRTNVYCYCLPENFDEVSSILELSLIKSVKDFLATLNNRAKAYEAILKHLTEKEEEENVAT